MTEYVWVIDTWVLATASDQRRSALLEALHLLLELRNHLIAIDDIPSRSEIVREYYPYISPPALLSHWWQEMISRGRVLFLTGRMPRRHRNYLLNNLRFDLSDMKFVDVAYRSPDKFLVSEDSDYTEEVKAYLKERLDITTFTTADALERARS